jgi:phospholipid/cholesterol/gamma-HCH transport system ATP-binding protein
MIGLLKPVRGRVLIRGSDLVRADEKERRRILLTFGVMFQSGALFGSMSLLENIMLPMTEFTDLPPDARELIARMKLRQVGLEGAGGLMPAELSGGMKKRAAIARALAMDPEVVFLDEPSAGLDPIASAGLDALIKNLADSLGKTFIMVTHELSSIFAVADRAVMLDAETKSVIADGRPADLRDNSPIPAVRGFFNRQVDCAAGL